MHLDYLTLVLTERCNLDCRYCRLPHRGRDMDSTTLERALDFFAPRLNPGGVVNFTGGEPLLALPLLERAVERLAGLGLRFALATNGTRITRDVADFLERHGFNVLLSWDGTLQERQRGASRSVARAARLLLARRGIHTESNTVITPDSVHRLERALRRIHAAGIPLLHVSPDRSAAWTPASLEELDRQLEAVGYGRDPARSTRILPLAPPPRGRRSASPVCTAGRDRLALSPAGNVWGCHRFVDFFEDHRPHQQYRRYCFGALEAFIAGFPLSWTQRLPAYRKLRPDFFHTSRGLCLDCLQSTRCAVCPVPFGTGVVGGIPESACRLQALLWRFSPHPCGRAEPPGDGRSAPIED